MLSPLVNKKTPRDRKRMIAKAIADGIVPDEQGINSFFARHARELGANAILAGVDSSEHSQSSMSAKSPMRVSSLGLIWKRASA
jgi:hypothetical protein